MPFALVNVSRNTVYACDVSLTEGVPQAYKLTEISLWAMNIADVSIVAHELADAIVQLRGSRDMA